MSMNTTPSGERTHIGFFGKRNAGKSSLVNAFTSQQLSVVSDVKGTTTDPVYKAMELLPMGPVMIIDTPGYDDEGALGELRIKKTQEVLGKSDVAILVVDAGVGLDEPDKQLISLFKQRDIPYLIALNKCDILSDCIIPENGILVSALTGYNVDMLKERVAGLTAAGTKSLPIVADLIDPGDVVVLVIPLDSSAPKGRLILPQQQTIRDILDAGGMAICTKETELSKTLAFLAHKPRLVITDSQAFEFVASVTPEDIPLTSFSILMARHKGFLADAIKGVEALSSLEDGDCVLISEGCTHHRQCEDIGTVKLPTWLKQFTGKGIRFETSSGREFPADLSPYKAVIHCGGCMLNERELERRMLSARAAGVPFTNYGTAIAMMKGIFTRSVKPLDGKEI